MAQQADKLSVYEDVLNECCCDEIRHTYTSLSDKAKRKLLEALKSTVEGANINVLQNKILNCVKDNTFEELRSKSKKDYKLYSKQELTVLRALESAQDFVVIDNFSELLHQLSSWGVAKPRNLNVIWHGYRILNAKAQTNDDEMEIQALNVNNAVAKVEDLCFDFSKLQKIFIKDLKLFETASGKYLEGRLITQPNVMVSIVTFLEDENGDYVQLGLHNMIPSGKMKWQFAERKFPMGSKIKISQPFYKIFMDGNPGIRVESPGELQLENERTMSLDDIRLQGKDLMRSGEEVAALEIYYTGLAQFIDTAVVLLNNRAQAEINLGHYEEALLDSAAVLTFGRNEKAMLRYHMAAESLGFKCQNKCTIMSIWSKVLQHKRNIDTSISSGTKQAGNYAFKQGDYTEAKRQYSAALKGHMEVCILLNNISVVCLKLNILQTAIAAASACLQISYDPKYSNKALYSMTKAFSKLGEFEFSKITGMNSDKSLEKFWSNELEPEKVADNLMTKRAIWTASGMSQNDSLTLIAKEEEPRDFIKTGSLQVDHIKGKGRGVKAIEHITAGDLLLIDCPVSALGTNIENDIKSLEIRNVTIPTCTYFGKGSLEDLTRKLLALVRFDGLLAKKMLLLDSGHGKTLPLVDLEWMAYRKLNLDILPFLPQSPLIVDCDIEKLTSSFIQKILHLNSFDCRVSMNEGVGLFLMMSLLNHDDHPNCWYARLGCSKGVFAARDIRKGEEVTISYGNGSQIRKKWCLNSS